MHSRIFILAREVDDDMDTYVEYDDVKAVCSYADYISEETDYESDVMWLNDEVKKVVGKDTVKKDEESGYYMVERDSLVEYLKHQVIENIRGMKKITEKLPTDPEILSNEDKIRDIELLLFNLHELVYPCGFLFKMCDDYSLENENSFYFNMVRIKESLPEWLYIVDTYDYHM